jgi:regulator of sigma D
MNFNNRKKDITPRDESARQSLEAGSKALVSIDTSFNKDLIATLVEEHQMLLVQLDKIEYLNSKKRHRQTRESMRLFVDSFVRHVAKEQYRVYAFLEKVMKSNPGFIQKMKVYRKGLSKVNQEMRLLRNEIVKLGVEKDGHIEFKKHLIEFRKELKIRIKIEEQEIFNFYDNYEDLIRNPKKYIPELGDNLDTIKNISELNIELLLNKLGRM